MSRGKIRKKGSHIRHAETLQIMPPAVPTWAVYKLNDGTCCIDRVHAWGLERVVIDGPGIYRRGIRISILNH